MGRATHRATLQGAGDRGDVLVVGTAAATDHPQVDHRSERGVQPAELVESPRSTRRPVELGVAAAEGPRARRTRASHGRQPPRARGGRGRVGAVDHFGRREPRHKCAVDLGDGLAERLADGRRPSLLTVKAITASTRGAPVRLARHVGVSGTNRCPRSSTSRYVMQRDRADAALRDVEEEECGEVGPVEAPCRTRGLCRGRRRSGTDGRRSAGAGTCLGCSCSSLSLGRGIGHCNPRIG